MTQDEIIEKARQAGAHDNGYEVRFVEPKYLERFAKLIAESEREACAKVCEDYGRAEEMQAIGNDFAQAIRARGQA